MLEWDRVVAFSFKSRWDLEVRILEYLPFDHLLLTFCKEAPGPTFISFSSIGRL
jgi:hypothetical protein